MSASGEQVLSFAAIGPPSDVAVVEKWIILVTYFVVWILLLFPSLFPLGRPGTASVGGVIIVFTKYCFHGGLQGVEEAIDFNTIALLGGLMGVAFYLEDFGLLNFITRWLVTEDSSGGHHQRLWRTAVIASVGSMFLTNDTVCLFLSPIICNTFNTKRKGERVRGNDVREGVEGQRASTEATVSSYQRDVDLFPYLLAISTFSNIGSAMSSIGNPQNVLVTSYAGKDLTFLRFLLAMAIPTIVALVLNYAMLLYCMRSTVSEKAAVDVDNYAVFKDEEVSQAEETDGDSRLSHRDIKSPTGGESFANSLSTGFSTRRDSVKPSEADISPSDVAQGFHDASSFHLVDEPAPLPPLTLSVNPRSRSMTYIVGVTFIILVVALILGVPGGLAAVLSATILMLASAFRQMVQRRHAKKSGKPFLLVDETNRMLRSIDYSILLLFIGQFILVGAFRDTGVAETIFDHSVGQCGEQILQMPCLMGFVAFITLFSNLISNVPLIILFRPIFNALPNPNLAWLTVAWFSTIAGNLIMMGSAANLIVANQAERMGINSFTTRAHGAFGIPSTFIIMIVGIIYFGYIFPHMQSAIGL